MSPLTQGRELKFFVRRLQFLAQRKTPISGAGDAFFRINDRKLEALLNATQNDMQRAEYAVLRRTNDQYRQIIFDAQVYANTGAGTVEKAVDMATHDFLSRGIDCIEYKNGARHTISDYADMYIRTAERRANLMGEGRKRQEWGVGLVIVNRRGTMTGGNHGRACPQCIPWLGKVLVDDVYSGGKPDGVHPLLSDAMAAGFLHPRCRDKPTTYFPGISSAPDPATRREIRDAVEAEKEESRENYVQRQAEKFQRLEKYSLDPENRQKYAARAGEWKEAERGLGKSDGRKSKESTSRKRKKPTAPEWNRDVGPETWTAKQRKAMWSAEWGTTGKGLEEARLYDAKGKRLFCKKGDDKEVRFTDDEIKQMRGGVLTHNHPGPVYGCFSPHDINMLRRGKLSEMRCVTPKGVFRIQRPEKWPRAIGSLEKVTDVYYNISNNIETPFFDRARMGEISFLDADNMAQEATVRELCKQFGIPFDFESWDSIREAIK